MNVFNLSKSFIVLKLPLLLLLSLSSYPVSAQYCIPQTTNYCCEFGITNVSFGMINKNSGNASAGYENFTSVQTNVNAGQTYTLSVSSAALSKQNIRAWIDFNNDTTFNPSTEQVLTANSVFNTSTSVFIPVTTLLNVPLRLRVSADYELVAAPTPCNNLVRGQAEDYSIIVQQGSSAPVAAFQADNTSPCNGAVVFTDLSANAPVAWKWDFGDGTGSTDQYPAHTYIYDGFYNITLIATNSFGSDTITKNNYLRVNHSFKPGSTSCAPVTTAYCCGYGIYNVVFGSISNGTAGGNESYRDYSCSQLTVVSAGMKYTLQVTTGTGNPEDVKAYVDWNNDGIFSTTGEQVFSSTNAKIHNDSVSVPAGATANTPLRMRIISDFVGSPISACTDVQWGQAEDYAVVVYNGTTPPVSDFSADSTQSCNGIVHFSDLSANIPTAWEWNFGDGATSTLKNPMHIYSANGSYNVSLKVTNPNGNNIAVKNGYITKSQTMCATDVKENGESNRIVIYPKPAKSKFYILWNGSATNDVSSVLIYSIQGKKIYNKQFSTDRAEIDVSGFTQGIYILQLESHKNTTIHKLVIEPQQ